MHKYINTCIRIFLEENNADENLRRGFLWPIGYEVLFYLP